MTLMGQSCEGGWCPVFLDTHVNDGRIVGVTHPARVAKQPKEVFKIVECVGNVAEKSGRKLRYALSS